MAYFGVRSTAKNQLKLVMGTEKSWTGKRDQGRKKKALGRTSKI